MSEYSAEELDAAREAAQNAVDTATSWDYSAGETKIADKLREGLAEHVFLLLEGGVAHRGVDPRVQQRAAELVVELVDPSST